MHGPKNKTQYKIQTKLNSHDTIKYPQYKVTLMYMVLCPQGLHHNFTPLQNKITLHILRQLTPHRYFNYPSINTTNILKNDNN